MATDEVGWTINDGPKIMLFFLGKSSSGVSEEVALATFLGSLPGCTDSDINALAHNAAEYRSSVAAADYDTTFAETRADLIRERSKRMQ